LDEVRGGWRRSHLRRVISLLLAAFTGPMSLLAAIAPLLLAYDAVWCRGLLRLAPFLPVDDLAANTPVTSAARAATTQLLLARLPLLLREQELPASVHAMVTVSSTAGRCPTDTLQMYL
jgi:hypothetical protein